MSVLTQNELKELLNYDPTTGVFTWRHPKSGRRGFVGTLGPCGIRVKLGPRRYFLHQLAWLYQTATLPKKVFHLDDDVANNKWANLSLTDGGRRATADHWESMKPGYDGEPLPPGIVFNARSERFYATIWFEGKRYYAGNFASVYAALRGQGLRRAEVQKEKARLGGL